MRNVLSFASLGALGVLLTGAAALADPAPPAARPAPRPAAAARADSGALVTDDCARARKAGKTCVLEVAAEDVGGATPTAGDTGIRALTFHPEGSLIRVRRDFIPEIVKTAEDL